MSSSNEERDPTDSGPLDSKASPVERLSGNPSESPVSPACSRGSDPCLCGRLLPGTTDDPAAAMRPLPAEATAASGGAAAAAPAAAPIAPAAEVASASGGSAASGRASAGTSCTREPIAASTRCTHVTMSRSTSASPTLSLVMSELRPTHGTRSRYPVGVGSAWRITGRKRISSSSRARSTATWPGCSTNVGWTPDLLLGCTGPTVPPWLPAATAKRVRPVTTSG
mmetsp:Transcript_2937/g.11965  ORF Transcript_2937/g.11965 Transcript_2937/m.11965 type:complete len:225 (+) Transcript_2937:841-1515(+)